MGQWQRSVKSDKDADFFSRAATKKNLDPFQIEEIKRGPILCDSNFIFEKTCGKKFKSHFSIRYQNK